MEPDNPKVVFTVKELLQRLDERLGMLDSKLDIRLVALDERVSHTERTQSERQYLIAEHKQVMADVAKLNSFRSRFLPASVVVVLLGMLGLTLDLLSRL